MKTKTMVVWIGIATLLTLALTSYYIFSLDKEVNSSLNYNNGIPDTAPTEKIDRTVSFTGDELKELESKAVSDPQYGDVKTFISQVHGFYNDTTGYGAISDLNDKEQSDKATEVVMHANYYIETEAENKDLVKDLKGIKKHALRYLENAEVVQVAKLHRYFHDLDIALNRYKGADRVWGITEVYGRGK